jgi:hypothetical protein
MRPTVRWRACSKSSCVSRPYPARDLILRATYFLCLIAVDVVGKHDFGRDILPHRESEVAKQSAVQGSLRMPVVQNGEDLWATLFVSDAVQSVHLPGGRIDDQTGLVLDLQSFMAALNNV